VSPAAFAAVLHDRLAEHAALAAVPGLADDPAAVAPLRVRTVLDEQDLRVLRYVRTTSGSVLALAPGGREEGLGPEDPLLVTPAGQRTLDGRPLYTVPL
jgi:hypothetical protein